MKKILAISLALSLLYSPLSAKHCDKNEPEKNSAWQQYLFSLPDLYVKIAGGSNYTDQLFDISNAKARSTERMSGFIGEVGAGYKLNQLFGVELQTGLKFSDKTYPLTATEMLTANEVGFDGSGPKNSDTFRYYKETGFDFSGKVYTEYPWTSSIYFTTGFGGGISYKSLATKYSTVIKQDDIPAVHDLPLLFSVKSKPLLQPFGFIALGADYRLSDQMSAGVEYDLRFNNTKMYTAKSNVKSYVIKPGSYSASTGITQMEADPNTNKYVWTKGHPIGNTSKTNHIFKVRLKILL